MYAAAGGASIANRRKAKRLQLSKQHQASATLPSSSAAAARGRAVVGHAKFSRLHLPPTTTTATTATTTTTTTTTLLHPPAPPSSSTAFHSSHDHHRHHHHHHHHHRRRPPDTIKPTVHHQLHRLAPPISPIFPISPPPLSLESPNSLTLPLKTSNNFPFPPPSFLDLRVSPTSTELQCGGQGPGKAAWQGCSRPSPLPLSPASPHGSSREGYKTKQCEAHRRWMKRNRIRDASYCYGSSGEDDDDDDDDGSLGGRRRPEINAAVNTVLYAGLGTTALGLVISFVGTGEKGFLSPELRLVGPSLLCAGLLCCLLRVLLCLCLCRCCGDCRWKPCKVVIIDKDKVKPEKSKKPTTPTATSAATTKTPSGQQPTTSLLPQHTNNQTTATSTTTTKITTKTVMMMPPMPCSSSHTGPIKGHELLLSPAQLPE